MDGGLDGWFDTKAADEKSASRKLYFILFVDVLVGVALFQSIYAWNFHSWSTFFDDTFDFEEKAADTLILAVLRVLCFIFMIMLAMKVAPKSDMYAEDESEREREERKQDDEEKDTDSEGEDDVEEENVVVSQKKNKKRNNAAPTSLNADAGVSLLSEGGGGSTVIHSQSPLAKTKAKTKTTTTTSTGAEKKRVSLNSGVYKRDKLRAEHMAKKKADNSTEDDEGLSKDQLNQRWLQGVTFFLSTGFQIYNGIKCVSFNFHSAPSEVVSAVLMGSNLLWINLELYLMEKLVKSLFSEAGYLCPEIHPHRIFYTKGLDCHQCDLCQESLTVGFRCKMCDFDLCCTCFKRKGKGAAEGMLRSDKGVKIEDGITTRQYLLIAFRLTKPYFWIVMVAVVCLLATSGAQILLPNFQGKILDRVIGGNEEGFKHDVLFFLILSVGVGFFGGVRGLCFNVVGRKMAVDIRNRLFESMIGQDIAFYDGTTVGQLTSRLSNDAQQMVDPIQTMLSQLLSNLLLLNGGLIMCFHTSWRLTILAFTAIGPIVHITKTYSVWAGKIYRSILAALGDANSIAVQTITNIRTVRAFGTEPIEQLKYEEGTNTALKKGMQDAFVQAGTFALSNYLDLGTSVLILWYGGHVVMTRSDEARLTVGSLITFQLYWNMINSAYQTLVWVVAAFIRAAGASQRALSMMEHKPSINPDATGLTHAVLKGALSFDQVRFTYQMRPDSEVLKGVSFAIQPGQTLALVGHSGGGKSTIINLLVRFYDPTSGSVLIDGENLTTLNLRSFRQQIGIVSQDTQLFSCTIAENIAYGHNSKNANGSLNMDEVVAAAKHANAHDFIMDFDEGYNTKVGDRGLRLSGGQKQRIAIARVFLRKPRILLLDEATSALDSESEALVQEAIDKLMTTAGCTIVLVAHRLSTVMNADKIVVIDKGVVVEEGTHEELVQVEDGPYAKLVKRQIAKESNVIDQD